MRLTLLMLVFACGCPTPKGASDGDWVEAGGDNENAVALSDSDGSGDDEGGEEDTGSDGGMGGDGAGVGSGGSMDGEGTGGDEGSGSGSGSGGGGATDEGSTPLMGFIGSPCDGDDDCPYEGGVCLLDGFPDGHCSAPCDLYCPDSDGFPVTFCVDGESLPSEGLEGGWCVSRCSFGHYSSTGCRDEYGCVVESRHTATETETYVCAPGEWTSLSECQLDLAARGVGFEPTIRAIDHPEGRLDLDCEIIDPVWVQSPLLGVDLRYVDSDEDGRVLAGCEMAHALADTVEDVGPYGVTTLLHIGTYNCRVISGTDSLSEHSFANAIDIYGFEFDDGTTWTLIDDWEHDTTTPGTEAGAFLYDASRRWYDDWIWNIILTPNYNLAHDNHFHVDLKPGFHDLSITSGRYYGPALYRD